VGFDPDSRYFKVDTVTRTVRDRHGRERQIRYKKRRMIPSYEDQPVLVEHRVTESDRLDNVTARYLGDPTQFWRICDANLVIDPEELEEIGRMILVKMSPE
jgi:hypothetical protein